MASAASALNGFAQRAGGKRTLPQACCGPLGLSPPCLHSMRKPVVGHSGPKSPLIAAPAARRRRAAQSRLLPSPCARRPRRRLPCGRLQSGWDTELSPRTEWLLRGGNDRSAGGRGRSSPALVTGWACGPAAGLRTCFKRSVSISLGCPKKATEPPCPARGSCR